jgi:1-acyl-sn-glycerol-3-phosphate acyltransferase
MSPTGSTAVSDPKAGTTTCAGQTRAGTRCRRRALAGSRYCSTHQGQATAAQATRAGAGGGADAPSTAADAGPSVSAPEPDEPRGELSAVEALRQAHGGIPGDIDRSELDAVKQVFDDGEAYGKRAREGQAPRTALDELRQALEFVTSNMGRVRDAAVGAGVVEAGRIEQFVVDLAAALTSLTVALAERASGDFEEDDFGFDERFTEGVFPLAKLLYDYYWRVEVLGIDNVPAEGRGLLVSNHAGGGLPFDGAMIKTAIHAEHPGARHAKIMVLDWMMSLPWVADFAKKTGQVLACTPNALELLRRDELVVVFPEGIKGMMKTFSQRYELERFGRGGFVRIALRTRSPIVPVAVVGSEEIYPKIANVPFVHKLIGAPFVPMTPLFPLFGVAGLMPLPSKWIIEFCEPIDVTQYPPEAADDRGFVLELSEQIRSTIQERLRENLLRRRTPFW